MRGPQYILAIDQGTTSTRAVIFDETGQQVAIARRKIGQIYPQPGWVEQDPQEIWSSVTSVVQEVLANAGTSSASIAGVGISNQRETTIVWDRETGRPVHNAIVWQDQRTASWCATLKLTVGTLLKQKTGLVVNPYFSASKLRWLLDHVPACRRMAETGKLAFGTVDSWLIWKMTAGEKHVTDVTNASRTLLFNIHTGKWDSELLEIFSIPPNVLPSVCSSSQVYGDVFRGLLPDATPVSGLAGDQQAALFGQMCTLPGTVKNTYGTGCFMLMQTGTNPVASQNNLLTTPAWQIGKETKYALEGSVFTAGAVVQWLRDNLGLISSASKIETLAATVSNTEGVYFVPAFTGLGAPHWDPTARGTIVGLSQTTTAAHIARAALESLAYQSADVLSAMESDSGISITELRADGGAAVNNLLMQFQADILGVPVTRATTESTALGAAYLAGLAVGFWSTPEDIKSQRHTDRVFEPTMSDGERGDLRHGWAKAAGKARHWITNEKG